MDKKINFSNEIPDFIRKPCFEDLSLPQAEKNENYEGYRFQGLIDLHLHGAFGWDFSWGDPEKIDEMLDSLLSLGLTGVVATLISCSEEQRVKALIDIKKVIENRRKPPYIHGIYLEGPFISQEKRGSHPAEHLMYPDFEALERWHRLSSGRIKIITVAPELPDAGNLISTALELGIKPAIGHTAADHFTTSEAIKIGADHVTHFFNAMRPFTQREPTAVSAILAHRRLTVELIADQIHVSPEIMSLTFKTFGPEGVVLISDGVCPMGLPDGLFDAYGHSLSLHNNKCTFTGGHLFGGGKHLLQCIADLSKFPGFSLRELAHSAFVTPAKILGLNFLNSDVIVDREFNWLATRIGPAWYSKS
ncbi:MAG: amidohydrolase family protein [Candidatus Riflebacteria bacterium]|nr:amidohydrolase family protein [Candidatus Riflebacteria bacterium]